MITYVNRYGLAGDALLAAGERVWPGSVPPGLPVGESVSERLDCLSDDGLHPSHPVVDAEVQAESRVGPSNPLGYVELDPLLDVYRVITVWSRIGASPECCELQLLAFPEKGVPLVAYTGTGADEHGRVGLDLKVDDSPSDRVVPAVPVDAGELVEPPDGRSTGAAGVVVRLCALDALARPLAQASVPLSVELLPGRCDGVLPVALPRWGILPGVFHGEFVEQCVEGGAEVVEPFAEKDRDFEWEFCGGLHHDPYFFGVFVEPLLDRVVLQVFGGDVPHRISVRTGSLDTGKRGPEISVWHEPESIPAETAVGSSR